MQLAIDCRFTFGTLYDFINMTLLCNTPSAFLRFQMNFSQPFYQYTSSLFVSKFFSINNKSLTLF